MSHDTEAAYASSEIAVILADRQESFFGHSGAGNPWNLYAGRESGSRWPLADGVILAERPSHGDVRIAFEFKRPNEGVHGILTAIGQSYAYLEKGYDAAIMAIPGRYSSHSSPGAHVRRVIDAVSPRCPVSVYTYDEPNLSAVRPFQGKLTCVRDIHLPDCDKVRSERRESERGQITTLWAHVREGMSHPDVFFRYCQCAQSAMGGDDTAPRPPLPMPLFTAVQDLEPNTDPYLFLSYTSSDSVPDRAWRNLWFRYFFWADLIPPFASEFPFATNETKTKIRIDDQRYQSFLSGRSDSVKNRLADSLNRDSSPENQRRAWKEYAQRVRANAHSYREVIDSGLDHIGFLDENGGLSDLGFRFVAACERTGTPYSGAAMEILRGAFLQNGKFGALLHYIYKYSEEKFNAEPDAFLRTNANGRRELDRVAYLDWLDGIFTNTLHISRKSSLRAGGTRRPFQAELTFLGKLGLVNSAPHGGVAFRAGVGLSIDWPKIQNSLLFFNGLTP